MNLMTMFSPDAFREVNAAFPWFFTGVFTVLGAMVGSFLNVCVYRIPKGLSVVTPGSRCACGSPIPWWRNIPVVAWLVWGRRTPCCGRAYSPRYAVVEALVAGLFAACWLLLPWPVAPVGMMLCAWLVVLAFIDLDTMYLPDSLNIGLAVAGVTLSAIIPALHGHENLAWLAGGVFSLGEALLGLAVGSAFVYWFRLIAGWLMGREAMGEGDVILVGAIGAFLGWQGALFSFFGGAVYGTLVMIPRMLVRRKPDPDTRMRLASRASMEGDESDEMIAAGADMGIPFGPWIVLAGVTYLLVAKRPVDAYFANFLSIFAEFRR